MCTGDQRELVVSYYVRVEIKLRSSSLTTNALTSSSFFFGKNICIGAIMEIVIFSFKIMSITQKTHLRKKIPNLSGL